MAKIAAAREVRYDRDLDVRGLNCPLPALRARMALRKMASGEILRVVSTERSSPRDMEIFAKKTGNALIKQMATRAEFVFYLRKA